MIERILNFLRFNRLASRKKLSAVVGGLVVILLVGIFLWSIKNGHLGIFASGEQVTGHIYDRNDKPIAGVEMVNVKGGNKITSDSSGAYTIGVAAGDITLTFNKKGTSFPKVFDDVPDTYWASAEINALKAANIVSGYSPTEFRPETIVNRDQMAVFIARALAKANGLSSGDNDGIPAGPASPSFSDVPTDFWAYKHIEYLKSQGVISGYADGKYHPEYQVDRAQMAVFISRAIWADLVDQVNPTFKDVAPDFWAYKDIETLSFLGIVSGYADENFRPDEKVTRAQMAVFISRAFKNIVTYQGGYIGKTEKLFLETSQKVVDDVYLDAQGEMGAVRGKLTQSDGSPAKSKIIFFIVRPNSNDTLTKEEFTFKTNDQGVFSAYNLPVGELNYYIIKDDGSARYSSDSIFEKLIYIQKDITAELIIDDLATISNPIPSPIPTAS